MGQDKNNYMLNSSMHDSRQFSTLTTLCFLCLFLVDEGREDPNITISGPSSARQRNPIGMAFRWRADDGPTLNAGLVAF